MNWKAIFQEIGKGYTSGLGRLLLTLTGIILTALVAWAWHYKWTDTQLLSVRQKSLDLCLVLLGLWGWTRFFLSWRSKRRVEKKLAESENQNKAVASQLEALRLQKNQIESQLAETEEKKQTIETALRQALDPGPVHNFLDDYQWAQDNGVWYNRKTGMAHCPKCTPELKIAPMHVDGHWLKCHRCGTKLPNPHNLPPPDPPAFSAHLI